MSEEIDNSKEGQEIEDIFANEPSVGLESMSDTTVSEELKNEEPKPAPQLDSGSKKTISKPILISTIIGGIVLVVLIVAGLVALNNRGNNAHGNNLQNSSVLEDQGLEVTNNTNIIEDNAIDLLNINAETNSNNSINGSNTNQDAIEEETVYIDSDQDGLSDELEIERGTNPNKRDTDDDGLSDREEMRVYLTDPVKNDTDGDGFLDGQEVDGGYNPNGAGYLIDWQEELNKKINNL